jgi:hypothetical protein
MQFILYIFSWNSLWAFIFLTFLKTFSCTGTTHFSSSTKDVCKVIDDYPTSWLLKNDWVTSPWLRMTHFISHSSKYSIVSCTFFCKGSCLCCERTWKSWWWRNAVLFTPTGTGSSIWKIRQVLFGTLSCKPWYALPFFISSRMNVTMTLFGTFGCWDQHVFYCVTTA